jgi:serine/threonine protein kinase
MVALNEDAILNVARAIESSAARTAYLDQVCGDDTERRARIEARLAALVDDQRSLQYSGQSETIGQPVAETSGQRIGHYRLREQIGEGGMGVVFVAEQGEPFHRQVAIKLIKPGMDSREVIGRFEAERQALALMDHPNIARVFDAGATDSGRPYFVMELVKGGST